ncbi:MAG: dipeptidase [Candidatus Dormibacteraceae bacterium]
MIQQAIELARRGREKAATELLDLIGIPSVSALREHGDDVRRAADWIARFLAGTGMKVEVVTGAGHPVVVAEWMERPGAPVLAVYGHYDVQPADPLPQWLTPPFEPQVREGFVYGRGATDDKGQLLANMMAAQHALAAGGPPVNLRFLIEGEEEIESMVLPAFLEKNAARLGTDYLFIADGHFTAPGMPSLTTGLRGLLYVEIEVAGPAADLHSGIFGGVAPNPFNSLCHIISGLKGRDGRVSIPGFYDDIRPPAPVEIESWRSLPLGEHDYLELTGAPALEGELDYSAVERTSSRPTLDVHGIMGGFTGEGTKTVIPALATAKVSMRLVPDQDPGRILAGLRQRVQSLATPGVRVGVRELAQTPAVLLGTDHAGVAAATRAFEAAFGAPPVLVREGGSIPVTADFQRLLRPHILATGFGLPDDGLHSPNERFSLDHYHRGTEMLLHLMDELGRAG